MIADTTAQQHGVFIGTEIEKILNYGTGSSNCKHCKMKRLTSQKNKHDYMMNWGDSS